MPTIFDPKIEGDSAATSHMKLSFMWEVAALSPNALFVESTGVDPGNLKKRVFQEYEHEIM